MNLLLHTPSKNTQVTVRYIEVPSTETQLSQFFALSKIKYGERLTCALRDKLPKKLNNCSTKGKTRSTRWRITKGQDEKVTLRAAHADRGGKKKTKTGKEGE